MNDEELRAALDGLYAYDSGSIHSGVHDEALRAACVATMNAWPRGQSAVFSDKHALLVREMWLSDQAIQDGYGLEDACEFVRWLSDRMGQG